MNEIIRIDTEELFDLAGRLTKLAEEIDRLASELRILQLRLPDDVLRMIIEDLMQEHKRMMLAVERAEGVSARVMWVMEDFEHCEEALVNLAREREFGAIHLFSGKKGVRE